MRARYSAIERHPCQFQIGERVLLPDIAPGTVEAVHDNQNRIAVMLDNGIRLEIAACYLSKLPENKT